ncbi:MAG: LytTR family DNA-binding domain-containing protein [Flavobacteriales bacterium]|nr:LytTR family DNA-binding domain-containing protein [Flavobacteriales bacterium]
MNFLIVEDEKPAANRLKSLILELEPNWNLLAFIDEVELAVNWLNTNPAPDVIFMDIQLADGYSFDIFDQVSLDCPIIFATAYDQYALNAFKVNGIDYLLKPIQKEELQASIQKFKKLSKTSAFDYQKLSELMLKEKQSYKERFLIRSGEQMSFVMVEEIAYFLSESSYSFIITRNGNQYILDDTLERIMTKIDPAKFFQINRKMIICIDAIQKITPYFNNRFKLELNPESKEEVIVSRNRIKVFKQWLDS